MKIDKQVIQNKLGAARDLENINQDIKSVYAKKEEIGVEISELQTSLQEAKSAKSKVLADFACNRATEKEVDAADSELAEIERKLSLAREMLSALERREVELGREFPRIQEANIKSNMAVFDEVTKNIVAEIDENIKSKVAQAYVANAFSGRRFDYYNFLATLFPEPDNNDHKAIRAELDKILQDVVK